MTWDPAHADAFRAAISATLVEFVDEQATRLVPLGDDATRLVAAAREAVGGGKRFRASFCYWGFRAVRYDVPDERARVRRMPPVQAAQALAPGQCQLRVLRRPPGGRGRVTR